MIEADPPRNSSHACYPPSEHLFQCLKFPHRPEIAKAIRKAESASDAVRMAKKNATDVRKGWRQEGLNIIAVSSKRVQQRRL